MLTLARSNLFFLMAVCMDVANVTAPAAESEALARTLWLPFQLSGALLGLVLLNIWAIPESRHPALNTSPITSSAGEREPLLENARNPPEENTVDLGHSKA